MLRYILIGLLCLGCIQSFGQNKRLDSLHSSYERAKTDFERANVLSELCFAYRDVDPEKTILYGVEGYELAREIDFTFAEALCLRNIGLGYYKKGDLDTAYHLVNEALILSIEYQEWKVAGDAQNTLGVLAYTRQRPGKAAHHFKKAIDYFIQADSMANRGNIASNMMNLGIINEDRGYYDSAIWSFTEASKLFRLMNNVQSEAQAFTTIGNLQLEFRDTVKALSSLKKARELNHAIGNPSYEAQNVLSIAEIEFELNHKKLALNMALEAGELIGNSKTPCQDIGVYLGVAQLFFKNNQIAQTKYWVNKEEQHQKICSDDGVRVDLLVLRAQLAQSESNAFLAGKYLQSAYDIVTELDERPRLARVLTAKYAYHRERGEISLALEYLEHLREIELELTSRKNQRDLARLEAEFEFSKERERIENSERLAKDELAQSQQTLLVICVALILMTALAIMSWRFYWSKQKTNQELNKINQRLTQLNDEKNTLIGTVAHDLKNPLAQIKGLTGLLLHAPKEQLTNREDFIRLIDQSSNRSLEMIDQILDVSAIENMKLNLHLQSLDVEEVLAESKMSFFFQADKKNINIQHLRNGQAKVQADEQLLRQSIDNLLSNALKFSEPGQTIYLTSRHEEDQVAIEVRDEGPGISKDDQERLFDKFKTLGHQTTGGEKSTGLGMAIVKRFIEEMEGSIAVESQPGHGTTFTILLPAA